MIHEGAVNHFKEFLFLQHDKELPNLRNLISNVIKVDEIDSIAIEPIEMELKWHLTQYWPIVAPDLIDLAQVSTLFVRNSSKRICWRLPRIFLVERHFPGFTHLPLSF